MIIGEKGKKKEDGAGVGESMCGAVWCGVDRKYIFRTMVWIYMPVS